MIFASQFSFSSCNHFLLLQMYIRKLRLDSEFLSHDRTWAQWRNVNTLLLATVVRIGLVIISYGCKVPAGIFVPSMAIGATFGRMVGIISKAIHA
jgi:chloride channel 3/4/5